MSTPCQACAAPSAVIEVGMSWIVTLATVTGVGSGPWGLGFCWPNTNQAIRPINTTPRATNPHRNLRGGCIQTSPLLRRGPVRCGGAERFSTWTADAYFRCETRRAQSVTERRFMKPVHEPAGTLGASFRSGQGGLRRCAALGAQAEGAAGRPGLVGVGLAARL